jgi:hypothetical protein
MSKLSLKARYTISWIADMGGPKQISFVFADGKVFSEFKKKHVACSFESKTKTQFKATKEDESWIYEGLVDKFTSLRLSESEEESEDEGCFCSFKRYLDSKI